MDCSSLMAAVSWPTGALMLGSLMMFASGFSVSLASSARLSGMRSADARQSENCPRMRAATEMSLSSISIPPGLVKARRIGSRE